jgi:acetyltransferase-like isoleucine patch superfamily enzyme
MNPRRLRSALYRLLFKLARGRNRLWSAYYKLFLGGMGPRARLARTNLLFQPERIFLGADVCIGHSARLEAITAHGSGLYAGEIHIGDGTFIEPYVQIQAAARLSIGKNVLMASRVMITDHDHQYADPDVPIIAQPLVVAAVRVEDFVWLGQNVVVLKGVTIGHHAVVGANSVVTKDVPPFAIVAGAPARILKMRNRPGPASDAESAHNSR